MVLTQWKLFTATTISCRVYTNQSSFFKDINAVCIQYIVQIQFALMFYSVLSRSGSTSARTITHITNNQISHIEKWFSKFLVYKRNVCQQFYPSIWCVCISGTHQHYTSTYSYTSGMPYDILYSQYDLFTSKQFNLNHMCVWP